MNSLAEGTTLLRFDAAAKALSISLRQFRRLVDSGRLPVVKVSERSPRVRVADLNAYLESVTVKHTAA